MKHSPAYWFCLITSLILSAIVGHLTTYIMEPGIIRMLTSFGLGVIIGIVGYEVAKALDADTPEDKV